MFMRDAYAGTGGFASSVRSASDAWEVMTGVERNNDGKPKKPGSKDQSTRESYLDPYPRESSEKFRRRIDASYYPNYVQPLTDLKLSYLLRGDFVADGRHANIERWREDADGAGTHVWLWIRRSKCRGYNLHGDMRLHGRPSYGGGDSLQRELAARSGGDAPAPDRVAGFVIYGDIPDMEYSALIGTFELTPAAALPPSLLGRLPIPSAWGSSLT